MVSDDLFARRRRPRPVAGVPPAGLADGRDLAKAWLLELIATAALADAGTVPAATLAQEGPDLCATVLAALADDAALARLAPEGDPAPPAAGVTRLTGAGDAAAVAAAVEGLRRAAWDLLQPTVLDGPASLAADLAARLAHVCAVITGAALAAPGRAPGPDAAATPPGSPAAGSRAQGPDAAAMPTGSPAAAGEAEPEPAGAFAVHDLRAAAGDPLSAAIAQRAAAGPPFALLAVEVDELDRLLATQRGREVAVGLEAVETALRAELEPGDTFLRERVGRVWALTGADGRALGERIADAVAGTAPVRGVPLTVSVGLACFPDDGRVADDLVARADEGLFAARAAGVPLA